MIAVITGDIVNSRKGEVASWIDVLKETLNRYGSESNNWEIYRGDSFQLSLAPEQALLAAFHIKSAIKQIKLLDVRMAIGLGEENYRASKVTESNGSAYVNSGECFEGLKKQTLGVKSGIKKLDEPINIMLSLLLLTVNNWSSTVSKAVKIAIEHPEKNQKSLAKLLNKSQSSISETLKRGGFDEIMKINQFYKNNI